MLRCRVITRVRVEGAGPRESRTKKTWCREADPLWSDFTNRGRNRGDSGHVPEAAEHERGERERVFAQHRLNARFLCTCKKEEERTPHGQKLKYTHTHTHTHAHTHTHIYI